jgi:hypothetical protein
MLQGQGWRGPKALGRTKRRARIGKRIALEKVNYLRLCHLPSISSLHVSFSCPTIQRHMVLSPSHPSPSLNIPSSSLSLLCS